jgi:hypothetical protein
MPPVIARTISIIARAKLLGEHPMLDAVLRLVELKVDAGIPAGL